MDCFACYLSESVDIAVSVKCENFSVYFLRKAALVLQNLVMSA